jgi:hypothetical protein
MTFDGNPEPVQFIQPNVHHRAGFPVGKHDGFADQFGLRRTDSSKMFDARRFTDGMRPRSRVLAGTPALSMRCTAYPIGKLQATIPNGLPIILKPLAAPAPSMKLRQWRWWISIPSLSPAP